MMAEIQPIIVDNGHEIVDLLNEVSLALCAGGLSWVDRARSRAKAVEERDMAGKEGWLGESTLPEAPAQHRLITSIDDLE